MALRVLGAWRCGFWEHGAAGWVFCRVGQLVCPSCQMLFRVEGRCHAMHVDMTHGRCHAMHIDMTHLSS
eukprot:357381-Chlamydomonas_euryale.AAC.8